MKINRLRYLILMSTLGLVACGGGGGGGPAPTTPATGAANNNPPVIEEMSPQSVIEREVFSFTSQATDSDGSINHYEWSQTSGTAVELKTNFGTTIEFTAPSVPSDETLTFEFKVIDNDGATTINTLTVVVDAYDNLHVTDNGLVECLAALGDFDVGYTELDCDRYSVFSIAELSGLTRLKSLTIGDGNIENIDVLENMPSLTSLKLNRNRISDISSLANLTQLTHLDLEYNHIVDIGSLAGKSALTELKLKGNDIVDISALSDSHLLQYLDVSYNEIKQVNALANMADMIELFINNNQIESIDALAAMTNLKRLEAGHNEIVDIAALTELRQLTHLFFSDNRIMDVSPLLTFDAFENVVLLANFNIPCDGKSALAEKFGANIRLSDQCTGTDIGSRKWTYNVNPYGNMKSTPAIGADGTIYICGWDGYLHAINPDGTKKWKYHIDGYIWASPAIAQDGTIYVGHRSSIHAVKPDGNAKWVYTGEDYGYQSVSIRHDGSLLVSGHEQLHALTEQGELIFTAGSALSGAAPSVAEDGTIYVTSREGKLLAFTSQGEEKWSLSGLSNVVPDIPIGADGTIYLSYHEALHAINPDGTVKWSYKQGGVQSSPVIGEDGTIYLGVDEAVHAVGPQGELKWSFDVGGVVDRAFAISSDGTIYVVSRDGNIYALTSQGTEKWHTEVNKFTSPATSDLQAKQRSTYMAPGLSIGEDGTVYYGNDSGFLKAFNADGGALADSPWPKQGRNIRNTNIK